MFGLRRWKAAVIVVCGLAAAGVVAGAALGREHITPSVSTYPDPSAPSVVRLHGTVGPGFTITLTDFNNNPITWLEPGTYTFTIDDLSNIHNFHLYGPGVDMQTTVLDTGNTTWTLKLTPGTYTFVCDPHASIMSGSLGVSGYGTVTSFPARAPSPVVHKVRKHRRR